MKRYEASYRNSAKEEVLEAVRRTLEDQIANGINRSQPILDSLKKLDFSQTIIDTHFINKQAKKTQSVYSRKTDDGLEVLTFGEVDGLNSEIPCLYKTSEVMKPQEWYDKFSPRTWETKNNSRVVARAFAGALGFTAVFQYAAADEMSLFAFGMGTIVVFTVSAIAFLEAGYTHISKFNPLRKQEVAKGVDALLYIADALEEKEPTKLQRVRDFMNTPIGDLYKSKVRVAMDELEAEFEEVEVVGDSLGAKR